jgi:hypothetical protein
VELDGLGWYPLVTKSPGLSRGIAADASNRIRLDAPALIKL